MSYTITAPIHRIGEVTSKQVKDKTYYEREVTLFVEDGKYANYPKFIVKKEDTARTLDNVQVGQEITLHFDIRGVEYGEGKNFTQIVFWKYELGKAQAAPTNISNSDDVPF